MTIRCSLHRRAWALLPIAGGCACALVLSVRLHGQTPAPKVDFRSDFQPVLRERCSGCDGPTQQRAAIASTAGARRSAVCFGRTSSRADLEMTQRSDGRWAQLPSLQSDAYATGGALVALTEAGVATTEHVYQRGVRFLLSTQLEDGSWYVRKRAHATQAFFDSGFPHGVDQYISAAATNWAAMSLALAARPRS